MTATEHTSDQVRLLSDAKHALEGIEALEKLRQKGFHRDENGDWVKTTVTHKSTNGKPWCLEMLWLLLASKGVSELSSSIEKVVQQISDLVQHIHPGTKIHFRNEVDEITPNNIDHNKFYIRVVSVEKPLFP